MSLPLPQRLPLPPQLLLELFNGGISDWLLLHGQLFLRDWPSLDL